METIAAPESSSRLIERPRLLAELDAAEARGVRAICLVAPAGYGKTVLAEQWVRSRHPDAIWHYATEASVDVAYVISDLARAAETVASGVSDAIAARLRSGCDPGSNDRDLADLLIRPLLKLGREPWLVVDDYQYLSGAAAKLIDALLSVRACRLVVTSRVRPDFASSRSVLYAESFLLQTTALEFDRIELAALAATVGGSEPEACEPDVFGWPVLARLAIGQRARDRRPGDSAEFFTFIAENVLSTLSEQQQRALTLLALPPSLDRRLARVAIGAEGDDAIRNALSAGLLHEDGSDRIRMHPLVREFLLKHLETLPIRSTRGVSRRIFLHLLHSRDYDGAFSVAVAASDQRLINRLLRTTYRRVLNAGRHETLRRWLAAANVRHPIARLVEAELELAAGNLERAAGIAVHAASATSLRAGERSRAFCIAGLAGFLSGDVKLALAQYSRALATSNSRAARSDALWGAFTATNVTDQSASERLLAEYQRTSLPSATTRVRYAMGRMSLCSSQDGWVKALAEGRAATPIVDEIDDPRIRTSFWTCFADVLLDAGYVDEAAQSLDKASDDAERHALHFVTPRTLLLRGKLALLEGRFARSSLMLRRAEVVARDDHDALEAIRGFRIVLALAQGRRPSPVRVKRSRAASSYLVAQTMTWTALANAVHSADPGASVEIVDEARSLSTAHYVTNVAAFASAVTNQRLGSEDAVELIRLAALGCLETGDVYSLVGAYRASPELVGVLLDDSRTRLPLIEIVSTFDPDLARLNGVTRVFKVRAASDALSPREREVLDLVAEGLTNREIASRLYIAESTAKLHVRRICGKLGVRSRTEAALAAVS